MTINLINYALAKKDWEKAYEDLKVLGVGGRNLLINSNYSNGTVGWTTGPEITITQGHATGFNGVSIERSGYDGTSRLFFSQENNTESGREVILAGETYTLSGWFYIDSSIPLDGTLNQFVIRKYQSGNSGTFQDLATFTVNLSSHEYDKWYYFETTGKVRDGYTGREFVSFALAKNGRVIVSGLKLEKGHKATPWTPAPEDINAHPFVVELAETVYRSKQNEERIRALENALTALGGGS